VLYEEMFPHELEEAVSKCPVVYVPCGLLEWHSTHLPLGIDGLKTEELCRRIALQHGGVVMPPIYMGMPGFSSFQGSITYSRDTVYGVFLETFQELEKIGFKVIVAVGGHYGKPQESTLKEAASVQMKRGAVKIWVLHEADVAEDLDVAVDHAGPWETSMGLELCGDLVDLESFRPGEQNPKLYTLPERKDRYPFEYRLSNFAIEQDLRTLLDREAISRTVAAIIDRIGTRALGFLESDG
jgi:creatinine amidohydrolase